jgi:hypothetical protein
MALPRRTALAACLCAALAPTLHAATPATPALPVARSLPDALQQALATGQPLVVMVSLEACPFCRMARENYLYPLHLRSGLPVVQVDMRSPQTLGNFQGQVQTHDAWIRAMNVGVAPTLLFFGRGGSEVVERMTGGYIPDFYGAYLDERLARARARLAG